MCRAALPDADVPTGTLNFDDLNTALAQGFFDQVLAFEETAQAYREFMAVYNPIAEGLGKLDGKQGFALRTMLVHDLRRVRLRSVDLPTDLLPADWSGAEANVLASELYHGLSDLAAPWLSEVLDLQYPAKFPDRLTDRT